MFSYLFKTIHKTLVMQPLNRLF